jgi:hypothetical protein
MKGRKRSKGAALQEAEEVNSEKERKKIIGGRVVE